MRSLLSVLIAAHCCARPAHADETAAASRAEGVASVSIEKVEIGFQGFYKVGEWTPVWVTLQANGVQQVQVVVHAPDPDDNIAALPGRLIDLENELEAGPSGLAQSGTGKTVEACFRTGRLAGELQVDVRDSAGRTLAKRKMRPSSTSAPDAGAELRPALKLDVPLWVTLGKFDLEAAFAESTASGNLVGGGALDSAHDPRLARFESFSQLPKNSAALQSVDLLVLPTGQPDGGPAAGSSGSLLEQITEQQNEVMKDWVRMGGHLLISVGAQAAEFKNSKLAAWVPINVDGTMPLRQLSSFESYSNRNAPVKISGIISAARLANVPRANAVLSDASNPYPIIASVPFGFGRVTIVAVDLDKPPLSNWPALKLVLQKLSRTGAGKSKVIAQKANRQLTHVGVSDLATQLQTTSEGFSGVRRPSYWWVMGLILVYVAVIGPLDYLLVHRLLRRPELTWLTFPLLMLAGIAAAAWYAQRVNGRDLQVNQFDLVDIDLATGAVRNNTWVSLYSPLHERFSIGVKPAVQTKFGNPVPQDSAVLLSWMGAPENSVGGMYRTGVASFGGREYRFGAASANVENVPVSHWSTKTLSAAWRGESRQPVVEGRLENFGTGQLRGTLIHHFDEPLEDCLVVAAGWAYFPTTQGATLQPGAPWVLTGGKGVRELRALLTGEKQMRFNNKTGSLEKTEVLTTTEAYNPLGRDLDQLFRMISFHDATGGSEYTGLSHAALRDLEMTDLMQLGQAVLIGRLKTPAAQVVVDDAPVKPADHATWVRLVLPVAQAGALPEKFIPKPSETTLPKDSEKRDVEP